jgi:hypothetical protein
MVTSTFISSSAWTADGMLGPINAMAPTAIGTITFRHT